MRGGKHLLLLAVVIALARCQKPKVSISPNFTHLGIFSGDLFYLTCENSSSPVKWYFNNSKQSEKNETLKITVAHPKHSGFYQCESNGEKSEEFNIDVKGYLPHASLTIKTGQPVMQTGGAIILHLENEDGLQGWNCWVCRGPSEIKKIVLRLKNSNDTSIYFQPSRLNAPETTFWCTDRNQNNRSNQITVRTSGKQVALQVYPLPPVPGENLTLRCLVWGADYSKTITFYQNNKPIAESSSATYTFTDVTKSLEGSYRCCAKFTYKAPCERVSDDQYVFVQVVPIKVNVNFKNELPVISILVGLVIVLGILLVAVGVYCYRKKNVTGPVYEDLERYCRADD